MQAGRWVGWALLFLAVGCHDPHDGKKGNGADGTKKEISLQPIKAKDWPDEVKKYQGKIVAVDVWATWCEPCMKHFPHHVEMAKKYAPEGVEFVSVALDEKANHDKALKFLKGVGATFTNYRMDYAEPKESQDLFDINGPPLYLVYDRSGAVERFYPAEQGKERPAGAAQAEMKKHLQKLIAKK